MKTTDYAKAAGIAFALLVINVLLSIAVVGVYAVVVAPGQPHEFYEQAAAWIVPWSCHIVGTPLFFALNWLLTARHPERNGYAFATVVVLLYAVIDAASVGFSGILNLHFALSMLTKLLASLVGVYIAICRRRPAAAELDANQ